MISDAIRPPAFDLGQRVNSTELSLWEDDELAKRAYVVHVGFDPERIAWRYTVIVCDKWEESIGGPPTVEATRYLYEDELVAVKT